VVNKYVGETEKNLHQVLDETEQNGTILLFDEADALFGKRSEVNDGYDRYANIEISYLLQGMGDYQWLAIVATKMNQPRADPSIYAGEPKGLTPITKYTRRFHRTLW